tara:strand:- start:53 stop:532 length:480 start_codon:yes stop_codon:yes gene_type:complete
MFKGIFSFILIFSFLFSHFSTEPCFKLEDCPKCEECVEKDCPPCPELKECICDECPPVCEGECYTDEEAQNIELYIQELEQKDSLNVKIIDKLENQIYMYIQSNKDDSLLIDLKNQEIVILNDQVNNYEKLVKEITPKWYENKWLWFGMGVFGTAVIVK